MRSTQWMSILTMYCILQTITFVESRKGKQGGDIELISKISSRKEERRKIKDLLDYSSSENSKEHTPFNSQKPEKLKGKKKYSFRNKKSYESEESIMDKKYYKRKNKKEENLDFKKKYRKNFRRGEENKDSHSREQFGKKENKIKSMSIARKSMDTPSEFSSKRFKRRSILNENVGGNAETEGLRFHDIKERNMKQPKNEANMLKVSREIRLTQNETKVSNPKGENNQTLIGKTQRNDGYCNNYLVQVNGCDEDSSNTTKHQNSKIEDEEIAEPRKVKYSIKFAHEKMSKKQKNKEAENILKLHRKAESNSMRVLKTTKRYDDTDEDSSEEVLPKRRLNLYEDEE